MSTDKELDDYLKGGSELSRAYADADDIAPPAHLDAAILAQAHRAVYARPAILNKRRWAMPLGLVATVFIMVMAGLQLPAMMKDDALMQAPQVASVAMERNAPMPTSVAPEPLAQTEPKQLARALKDERANVASKKMVSEVYAKQEADKVAMAAAPVAAPAPAAPSVVMANQAEALMEERQAMSSGKVNAAPQARMAAAPVMADQLLKAKDVTLSPEDWLKQIKALQQADKLEEAKKELVAFKKRYPDYQIPKAMEMP